MVKTLFVTVFVTVMNRKYRSCCHYGWYCDDLCCQDIDICIECRDRVCEDCASVERSDMCQNCYETKRNTNES